MRRLLTVWCVLGISVLSAVQRDPWLRIRSADFELFTSAPEPGARDLIRFFEQVHSFFEQAFSLGGSSRPVRIVSFRSDKEFQYYRPTEVADAFFQPGADHDYIVIKSSSAELYPTAIHEYTHLLLRHTGQEIPHWLNEGLAELYSSLEPEGSHIIVGKILPGRARTLAREPWIDLRELVSAPENSSLYTRRERAEMFYAESWALVHMLALDNRYSAKLHALMDSLKDHDAASAFQQTYGKPITKVQDDLRAYLNANSINAAVFNLQLPDSLEEPAVEAGASMLSRLALAELLSYERNRVDAAYAAYRALSRDFENRWEVEESWGEFLLRERRSVDAVQHLGRAAGLGCNDPEMYIRYARALNLTSRSADAARVLRSAIALDPSSDQAHFDLAVTLVRTAQYREALNEFHAIKHLGPEHAYRYYYFLAYAHSRLGDTAQAKALIDKARGQTRNPSELADLNRLQQSLTHP